MVRKDETIKTLYFMRKSLFKIAEMISNLV